MYPSLSPPPNFWTISTRNSYQFLNEIQTFFQSDSSITSYFCNSSESLAAESLPSNQHSITIRFDYKHSMSSKSYNRVCYVKSSSNVCTKIYARLRKRWKTYSSMSYLWVMATRCARLLTRTTGKYLMRKSRKICQKKRVLEKYTSLTNMCGTLEPIALATIQTYKNLEMPDAQHLANLRKMTGERKKIPNI